METESAHCDIFEGTLEKTTTDEAACSRSATSSPSKSSLNSDEEFSEDPGNDEADSIEDSSVASPENCVYFLTSSPPGKILYINSNTNSLHEFPPVADSGNRTRECKQKDRDSENEVAECTLEVVSLCAERSSLWALTKDGSLFVYMFPSGARIRRQVHTYENQRYRLTYKGWTDKLMRVDRYSWSSRGGQKHLPKSSFKLLNETCWKWDGQWRLAEIMDNQPTEQDGWLYAKNFTQSKYGPMGTLSFVRRRKWIRYMSYSKVSQWGKIDDITIDSSDVKVKEEHSGSDTYYDLRLLAVGGSLLSGCSHGYLSVWAVRRDKKILFREGISASRPEGERWRIIEGTGESIIQIVTSPKGYTWILNWSGTISIRAEISSKTPWGTKWVNLDLQHQEDIPRFSCLSVGERTAWAVSAGNQKVYFLPNVEAKVVDYKWIEVVGNMFGIFVGLNNQVWAISLHNRAIVSFREKVTPEELSGKTWKILKLDFNEIVSCRQPCEKLSLKDYDVTFQQVAATAFHWGQKGSRTMPLHWFMKIPNFRPSLEIREEITADFAKRDKREIKCFENVPEFLDSKVSEDSQHSGLSLNSELSCNLYMSSNGQLKVSDHFSNCLIVLEKPANSECAAPSESKLVFTFAKATVQVMLAKITYIRHIINHDKPTLILTTAELAEHQLYFSILFDTYKEMFYWHDTLQARGPKLKICDASQTTKNSNQSFCNQNESNVFCIDEMGYSLIHTEYENYFGQDAVPTDMWFLLPSHFEKIVSNGELSFGLNADSSVWFHKGTLQSCSLDSNTYNSIHRDSLTVCVEEIETWSLPFGFHGKYFSVKPQVFSNDRKSKQVSDDHLSFIQLPSTRWEWFSENWSIDYTNCDHKGWSYTADIANPSGFHAEARRSDVYRRRVHKRTCTISQKSFWKPLSSKPALKDLTLSFKISGNLGVNGANRFGVSRNEQVNKETSLWGLGSDGSLYQGCIQEPSKNEDSGSCSNRFRETEFCWKQIVNDYTLLSICSAQYSGGSILWGICQDGITLLLHYPSYSLPIDGPPVVQPPYKQSCLKKVECGGNRSLTIVLDCYNMVWIREGASWDYPEGTSWTRLASGIIDISVDADSNVWVVLESVNGQSGVVAQLRNKSNKYANSPSYQQSASSYLKNVLYHKNFIPILKMGPRIKHISANSFSQRKEMT